MREIDAVSGGSTEDLKIATIHVKNFQIDVFRFPGITAVAVHHLGFGSLNACRIAYTIEERGAVEKYGFAYGTLPDHAKKGEERFTVEFHANDETVWYDIYTFSRPGPLARLVYPFTRALQKRFASDSKRPMHRAVEQA